MHACMYACMHVGVYCFAWGTCTQRDMVHYEGCWKQERACMGVVCRCVRLVYFWCVCVHDFCISKYVCIVVDVHMLAGCHHNVCVYVCACVWCMCLCTYVYISVCTWICTYYGYIHAHVWRAGIKRSKDVFILCTYMSHLVDLTYRHMFCVRL